MQNNELKKNSEVLRKCAFCGGEVDLFSWSQIPLNYQYGIECRECHTLFQINKYDTTMQETIKAWNNRKPAEEVVARLEECSKSHFNYWDEFDDEYSFGSMNAYMNAIAIVKEGMG